MKSGTQNHLKVKRLRRLLGIPLYRAVGILECLWLLCADCCDEGNIGKFTDDEIADYLEWDGNASELIRALSDSGWTDSDDAHRLIIHDWLDHCPEYIRDRIRKRHARANKTNKQTTYVRSKPDNTGTNTGHEPATTEYVPSIPNPTQPNQSKPNQSKPSLSDRPPKPTRRLFEQDGDPPEPESDPPDEIEFLEAWNAAEGNVKARLPLSAARKRTFRVRIRDPAWDWRAAIAKFPLKLVATAGADGWKPDLDWFLRPDSVTKILEGKYDWSKNGKAESRTGPGQEYRGE